jgi:collagenase-like PrtC family protease
VALTKKPRRKPKSNPQLTLGPVLFNWSAEKWRDFYFRIADEAPVDTVCVGEVVCLKRWPFFEPFVAEVVERLESAGKEVVRSTLSLIMDARDLDSVRAISVDESHFVEVNDVAALTLLAGRPFATGPMVNVYNEGTLDFLERRGAKRISLPVELPRASLAALARQSKAELEVQVYGRLPLAISVRCFHARAHGLHKDGCQYVCGEDADGMPLTTLDGTAFLRVNGTQALSDTYGNLVCELDELRAMGIHRFRLSPQNVDMIAVAQAFRDVLAGSREPEAALGDLARLAPGISFSNGFFHGVEGVSGVGPLASAE